KDQPVHVDCQDGTKVNGLLWRSKVAAARGRLFRQGFLTDMDNSELDARDGLVERRDQITRL
ncbi:hypothetical protein E4U54_008338, partial [Claviceps lovelessii]